MTDKKDDKSTWAIGGGTLIGIGAGFTGRGRIGHYRPV